jgi:hypothetical protein
MDINELEPQVLLEVWAERFKAFSELFAQFSTPESVQELFTLRASGDPEAFRQITDRFDLPVYGGCVIVREVLDTAMAVAVEVEVCRIKENLTLAQLMQAARIISRYQSPTIVPSNGSLPALVLVQSDEKIDPGPLLDELKAAGLVTCATEKQWIGLQELGLPTKICF